MAELFDLPSPGKKPIVLIGAGETADMLRESFEADAGRHVEAFAVEPEWDPRKVHQGLPVVPITELASTYPPSDFEVMVAVSFSDGNRVRQRLVEMMRGLGYDCANYISSRATVWRSAMIGDNVCIFENAVVQHHAVIGTGATLWSNAVVTHRARIGAFSFLAFGSSVGGFSRIGERCFIGASATIIDEIEVASDVVLGAGATVVSDIVRSGVYVGTPARVKRAE